MQQKRQLSLQNNSSSPLFRGMPDAHPLVACWLRVYKFGLSKCFCDPTFPERSLCQHRQEEGQLRMMRGEFSG